MSLIVFSEPLYMFTVSVGGEGVVRPGFEHLDCMFSQYYKSANLGYGLTYVGLTAW